MTAAFKNGDKVKATVNLGYPDVKIPKGTKGIVTHVSRNFDREEFPYEVRFNNDERKWVVRPSEIEKRIF